MEGFRRCLCPITRTRLLHLSHFPLPARRGNGLSPNVAWPSADASLGYVLIVKARLRGCEQMEGSQRPAAAAAATR